MAYELYPAVDPNYDFPPEIRARLAVSPELRNTVIPMTTSVRNNLTGADLWDGRLILNTTTDRVNRYDLGTLSWTVLMEQADLDAALLKSNPIGSIVAYASNVAPSGWHLCNGTVHSSLALQTVLSNGGHANPHLTPNLQDKFILGDGGSKPTTGGLDVVTLSSAQVGVPAHGHTATSVADSHDHVIGDPHMYFWGDSYVWAVAEASGTTRYASIANLTFADDNVPADSHSHTINVANATAVAATSHENMPPYYALTYIIKTV